MTAALRRRGLASLAGASVVTGVLAYVFFVVATRALGPTAAAPVSVLWTYWGFTGAAITFPVQHWIVRTVTASGGERAVRLALPRLGLLLCAVALAAALVATAARSTLFGRDDLAFPALIAAVTLGAGLLGLVRGQLTARRRFGAVGAGLVLENALRCVAVIALAALDVRDPRAYGVALVVGYAAAAGFPSALTWAATGERLAGHRPASAVGAAGAGQLLAQIALTGGPVALALTGGSAGQVTALFAGLALFRAPYAVATGMLATLTEQVTRWWLRGSRAHWRRLRWRLGAFAVIGAAVAAPVGAWLGPGLVGGVFGEEVALDPVTTALLASGTVVALANLVLAVVLVAQARGLGLARGWCAAALPGAAWLVWTPSTPLHAVAWAFLIVETAAYLALTLEELAGSRKGPPA